MATTELGERFVISNVLAERYTSKNQLGNDFSPTDLVVSNLLEIVKLAQTID